MNVRLLSVILEFGALHRFSLWSIWLVSLGISLVRQPKLN